jgi:two-component system sensor histidine kinase BaeS
VTRGPRTVGLGPRLLLAQGLVILAGAGTLLAVALVLAPGLFRDHVDQAAGPITEELRRHIDEAFARATLISLGVGVIAALVTALAVSWVVTRRIVRPVQAMGKAAGLIAAGDYAARVGAMSAGAELEALGRAFDHMAVTLAATERTRTEMLRDLAHELRTPLTTVRGYVEALADGVMTLDPDSVGTIDSELARVERLVDDVATVSRAEERRLDLHLRPTAPGDLVAAVVAAVTRAFGESGVTLLSEVETGLPLVVADPDRVQEVLANLLDNALRHTPAQGRVTVTARRGAGAVELVVADTGDGLAPEHLPRVFERFYRVDGGRSPGRGGSGIGLAIARALVEAHGGRLRAESPGTGRGSTFTVSLPAQAVRP